MWAGMWGGGSVEENWEEKRVGLGWGGGKGSGVRAGAGPLADALCDTGEAAYFTSLRLSFPLIVRPIVPPSQGCCEDNMR